MMSRRLTPWLFLLFATALNGCGGSAEVPALGQVTGTVTLDGDPLVGVNVVFKPAEGRAATGLTDAEGKYTLLYNANNPGSKTGANTVSMDWPTGTPDAQLLPSKYTSKSELTADVVAGSNTFDFKLESTAKTKGKKAAVIVD